MNLTSYSTGSVKDGTATIDINPFLKGTVKLPDLCCCIVVLVGEAAVQGFSAQ